MKKVKLNRDIKKIKVLTLITISNVKKEVCGYIYDDNKYKVFDATYITDSLHQLIRYYGNENIESNYVNTPFTYTDSNIILVLLFLANCFKWLASGVLSLSNIDKLSDSSLPSNNSFLISFLLEVIFWLIGILDTHPWTVQSLAYESYPGLECSKPDYDHAQS